MVRGLERPEVPVKFVADALEPVPVELTLVHLRKIETQRGTTSETDPRTRGDQGMLSIVLGTLALSLKYLFPRRSWPCAWR